MSDDNASQDYQSSAITILNHFRIDTHTQAELATYVIDEHHKKRRLETENATLQANYDQLKGRNDKTESRFDRLLDYSCDTRQLNAKDKEIERLHKEIETLRKEVEHYKQKSEQPCDINVGDIVTDLKGTANGKHPENEVPGCEVYRINSLGQIFIRDANGSDRGQRQRKNVRKE